MRTGPDAGTTCGRSQSAATAATSAEITASIPHTGRHAPGPATACTTAVRLLLAITPTPTPLPVSPMARPRRDTRTADPAMPGAGTQIIAPPNPARTMPVTRTGTDGASARTDSPAVVISRPVRTEVAGAMRSAVRLTRSVPARYAVRFSVPSSPATT